MKKIKVESCLTCGTRGTCKEFLEAPPLVQMNATYTGGIIRTCLLEDDETVFVGELKKLVEQLNKHIRRQNLEIDKLEKTVHVFAQSKVDDCSPGLLDEEKVKMLIDMGRRAVDMGWKMEIQKYIVELSKHKVDSKGKIDQSVIWIITGLQNLIKEIK